MEQCGQVISGSEDAEITVHMPQKRGEWWSGDKGDRGTYSSDPVCRDHSLGDESSRVQYGEAPQRIRQRILPAAVPLKYLSLWKGEV
jgi:hypothetical protein